MSKCKLSSKREVKATGAKAISGSTFSKEGNLTSGSVWTCKDSEWNPLGFSGVCIGLKTFGAQPFDTGTSTYKYFCGTIRMAGLLPTYTYDSGTSVNVLTVSNYSGTTAVDSAADLCVTTVKSSCVEVG